MLIDPCLLGEWRSRSRGRAYATQVVELAAMLRGLFHLPLRQTEGVLRGVLHLMGLDKDMAPDYSTLARRFATLELPNLPGPHSTDPICIVIDSTGVRISEARGWHQDRAYAGDSRRTKYLKLHLAIDAATGQICGYDITKPYGRGTGDPSMAPALITEAAEWALAHNTHLSGGIGDGAYDDARIYHRMRTRGGRWLAPLPTPARRGSHPDRDTHITGTARLGEEYLNRIGYHQRSTIEAANGALKRTVGLASRARSFEAQGRELAWQLQAYAELTALHPR